MYQRLIETLCLAALLALFSVAGCGDPNASNCPVGSRNCECTVGGACDPGLECTRSRCTTPAGGCTCNVSSACDPVCGCDLDCPAPGDHDLGTHGGDMAMPLISAACGEAVDSHHLLGLYPNSPLLRQVVHQVESVVRRGPHFRAHVERSLIEHHGFARSGF